MATTAFVQCCESAKTYAHAMVEGKDASTSDIADLSADLLKWMELHTWRVVAYDGKSEFSVQRITMLTLAVVARGSSYACSKKLTHVQPA
jgi:hypothetical protein